MIAGNGPFPEAFLRECGRSRVQCILHEKTYQTVQTASLGTPDNVSNAMQRVTLSGAATEATGARPATRTDRHSTFPGARYCTARMHTTEALPDMLSIGHEVRKRPMPTSVTVVHHTFYGFAIQSMGGQCEHSETLPTVPCVSRSKVMEMGEHSPNWGKPAKLPIVLYARPLSHLGGMVGVWRSMVGLGSAQWWAAVNPTYVAPLDTSLGNPIPSLSRP